MILLGTIPSGLYNMSKIENLFIQNNQFTGKLIAHPNNYNLVKLQNFDGKLI